MANSTSSYQSAPPELILANSSRWRCHDGEHQQTTVDGLIWRGWRGTPMKHRLLVTAKSVVVAAALFATGPVAVNAPVAAQRPNVPDATDGKNAWKPPRLPDGHPDLQGIWSFATVTPLERPDTLATKPFLTDAEAAEQVK